MTSYTLTKTRFLEGVWEGIVTSATRGEPAPQIVVTHLGEALVDVQVEETGDPGTWSLRVPVPPDLVGDGVRTFVISDGQSGETLDSFALIGGDALAGDIRAEMALLRAELDLLKRAFRRHCREAG